MGPESEENFDGYLKDVRREQLRAHRSAVWLLTTYRVLRFVGVLAAALTPVLAALNSPKWWTVGVGAIAALAVGVVQLTRIDELSILDRDRSDRLLRELRYFDNHWGDYANDSERNHKLIENVEQIRRSWEINRQQLVRRTLETEPRQHKERDADA